MKPWMTPAAAVLALALNGAAMAATDGNLGATSSGAFIATMTVQPPTPPATVQISGLDDLQFGTIANGALITQVDKFCVTRSDGGLVQLLVEDQQHPGASQFTMTSGANALAFNVLVQRLDPYDILLAQTPGSTINLLATDSCTEATSPFTLTGGMAPPDSNTPAGIYSGTIKLTLSVL